MKTKATTRWLASALLMGGVLANTAPAEADSGLQTDGAFDTVYIAGTWDESPECEVGGETFQFQVNWRPSAFWGGYDQFDRTATN